MQQVIETSIFFGLNAVHVVARNVSPDGTTRIFPNVIFTAFLEWALLVLPSAVTGGNCIDRSKTV